MTKLMVFLNHEEAAVFQPAMKKQFLGEKMGVSI
jgi:hypothetical protein